MLSLYTTSCVSYDEDIDDIYKRLEELQTQIDAIKKQIEEGNYVVSVEKLSNGIRIKFIRGESYDIINGTNGKDGANAEEWHISPVDSMWYKGGVKQPFRAVGEAGKQGETAPSPEMFKKGEGKYYWIVFRWDGDTNDFIPDTLDDRKGCEPLYSYNTYVVDRTSYYELHVWVEDPDTPGNSKYDIIRLPKEGVTNPFLEFLGYDRIRNPKSPISLGGIKNEIDFFYWHLSGIHNATDGGVTDIWVGRKTVKKHQVLTTLERDSAAAIIRTNLPNTSWKLILKDSQGELLLPINFGTPVRHEGNLTKASSNDLIYILQMGGVQDTFPSALDYDSKFKKDGGNGLVYSLIDTVTGINSGYKAFISQHAGNNGDLPRAILSTIGEKQGTDKEYQVSIGDTLKIGFTNADYLYDYYIEAVDPTQAAKFGFTVYKTNGTFKVTQTDPDEKFKAIIYELHYNGKFFKDTVTIKPIVAVATP